MKSGSVQYIFPIPIGFYNLDRELSIQEHDFILASQRKKNIGNEKTIITNVLDQLELSQIRNFIDHAVEDFFVQIYQPRNDVTLRITQSWVNYTGNNQYHHKHSHPNSFVSGVFYIQVDEFVDKIYFYNESYRQIEIPANEYNIYNSKSWWFPCITGQLLLFPSHCSHMVETRPENEKLRISLSFNTFPVGELGDIEALTSLKLQ